jgi:thiamine-phosphate pyrophosphorylase
MAVWCLSGRKTPCSTNHREFASKPATMANPQFFLVAPSDAAADMIATCAAAAAQAGDCASIVISAAQAETCTAKLQAIGLAVLLGDSEARAVHYAKADGLHLSRNENVKEAREQLKKENLGVFTATSRHYAMEAAELGADYIAFAQKAQHTGEPLISWWQEMFEIPVVAFDPVTPEDLATLLPQRPDFIRPSDAMWQNADEAKRVISALQGLMQ